MRITRSTVDTQEGPAGWSTGAVYIDAIAAPAGTHRHARAGRVRQLSHAGEHVTGKEYTQAPATDATG